MSRVALILSLAFCFFGTCRVHGQSTISDRPFELSIGQGMWGALLPKYVWGCTLEDEYDEIPRSSHHIPRRYLWGENRGDQAGISDDMNLAGYQGDFKLTHRFLDTRTSFESRIFCAIAESAASGSEELLMPVLVPRAHNQNEGIVSGTWRLNSDVQNYGFDLSLRDTWVTRFGGLSAGFAFSYIALDQTFKSTLDNSPLLREELDADYRGGKVFVGWDGWFRSTSANLDMLFGLFDMKAHYDADGFVKRNMAKTVPTIEVNLTTRRDFRDIQIGTTLGMIYLADVPLIEHNFDIPVSIGTDNAVTFKFLFEVVL